MLLEAGLASAVNPPYSYYTDLENKAKAARKHIWEDWDEQVRPSLSRSPRSLALCRLADHIAVNYSTCWHSDTLPPQLAREEEAKAREAAEAAQAEKEQKRSEMFPVIFTEILDGRNFFIQLVDEGPYFSSPRACPSASHSLTHSLTIWLLSHRSAAVLC